MGAVTAVATVLGIVVSILTIVGMLGGKTKTIATIPGTFDREGKFHPGPPPPLPMPLTPEEFERTVASMPVKWVTYEGTTPPLNLKIRGASEEMFVQACRRCVNDIGQDRYDRMTVQERENVVKSVMAGLYVLGWQGARYSNGSEMPFSPPDMTLMLERDPHLVTFLSEQVRQISPSWGTS